MSKATATANTNNFNADPKKSESASLKEFRTPPHNLAIEQAARLRSGGVGAVPLLQRGSDRASPRRQQCRRSGTGPVDRRH